MTFIERLGSIVDRILNRPKVTNAGGKAAGMWVDNGTALMHAGVWGCVRLISQTIASLGWHIIKLDADGTREKVNGTAIAQSIDRVLNIAPNAEMTAFTWRELAVAHVLLSGNHYSEIERDVMGRVLNLWPIPPERVWVFRDPETNELFYRIALEYGGERVLPARDVLHLKGLGWDGLTGISVIGMARRSIGAGLAMDEYTAQFYANGTHLGLILQHPKTLSDQARNNLTNTLKQNFKGPGQAFRAFVVEEGITVNRATMTMQDAQFIESKKAQLADIARWFGVPLHKIAELDRSTNNNIEHQSIEFVQDAILPMCRRLESECDIKLFGRASRSSLYTRLNIDTLLRGDAKSRNEAYAIGRNGGWLSVNDIRQQENMDPITGGDEYLVPLNMTTAGAPTPADPNEEPEPNVADDTGTDDDPATTAEDKVRRLRDYRTQRRASHAA